MPEKRHPFVKISEGDQTNQMIKKIYPLNKIADRCIDMILVTIILSVISIYIAQFYGIHPYIVKSGSMEPSILTGSLCMVDTRYDYKDVSVGDVIAFELGNTMITHRVIEITHDGFITQGDNNDLSDGLTTTETNYIGKTIISFPILGYLISWIQTKKGKIILITIALAIGILYKIFEGKEESC